MSCLLDAARVPRNTMGVRKKLAPNRIRTRREQLGLSQKYVAASVGVSRQSLNAIETERTSPNVALALRLASVLGNDVETLFGAPRCEELEVMLGSPGRRSGARVLVGCVRERWVAHALATKHVGGPPYAADGFVRKVAGSRARVELARPRGDLEDTVFLSGCAPGLSVLADRLDGGTGEGRFRWLMHANQVALRALARGHVHIAGVHLPDDEPEQLSRLVARHLPTEQGALYAFAKWQAGLVVSAGNPARIRGVEALEQSKLRVALREEGSGAHLLLSRLLREVGVGLTQLRRRSIVTHSHMEVAQAVQLGAADVGFSIRAAAIAFGLDFVPLVEERFDLVVPSDLRDDARVARLLEALSSGAVRRELVELGYDAREAGKHVSQIHAA